MWKIIFAFLWEYIVGKDVRIGKAYRHHKFRIIFFIVLCGSLFYNYVVTNRLLVYYEAFITLEKKYEELKIKNKQLEEDNRNLEKVIINNINYTKPNHSPTK